MKTTLVQGDNVAGNTEGSESQHGRIVKVDGSKAYVAWEAGFAGWTPLADLVPTDEHICTVSKKCTVYFRSVFGYRRVECRSAALRRGKWAQYARAAKLTYTQKGCRNMNGTNEGYQPRIVIIEGHNHPDMSVLMEKLDDVSSRSRHSACSPAWDSEFDAALSAYVEKTGTKVLGDTRGW